MASLMKVTVNKMKSQNDMLQRILKLIRESSLRMTKKREHLLTVLSNQDRPISASELRDRARLPKSDLVTVYRILEAFEGLGIVQRIPLESNGCLFELTEPNDPHNHLVCRECHRAERLDLELSNELETKARESGFTKVRHVMEVYGLCQDCRPKLASVD